MIIFDDSFEHEVWNETDEPRIVLIVDLWHPQLRTDAERRKAIEQVAGAQGEQSKAQVAMYLAARHRREFGLTDKRGH